MPLPIDQDDTLLCLDEPPEGPIISPSDKHLVKATDDDWALIAETKLVPIQEIDTAEEAQTMTNWVGTEQEPAMKCRKMEATIGSQDDEDVEGTNSDGMSDDERLEAPDSWSSSADSEDEGPIIYHLNPAMACKQIKNGQADGKFHMQCLIKPTMTACHFVKMENLFPIHDLTVPESVICKKCRSKRGRD